VCKKVGKRKGGKEDGTKSILTSMTECANRREEGREGGREGGKTYLDVIGWEAAGEFHHLLLEVMVEDHALRQALHLALGMRPPAAKELHLGREGGREGGMRQSSGMHKEMPSSDLKDIK